MEDAPQRVQLRPRPVGPGAALADTLMWEQGLVVRSFRPGSRLEDHLRVTVRTPGDHERLLSARRIGVMSRSAETSREDQRSGLRSTSMDRGAAPSRSVGFRPPARIAGAPCPLRPRDRGHRGPRGRRPPHRRGRGLARRGHRPALGDRSGITRFGDAVVPMDEAIARASVDAGGRPFAVIELEMRNERIGNLTTQNLPARPRIALQPPGSRSISRRRA